MQWEAACSQQLNLMAGDQSQALSLANKASSLSLIDVPADALKEDFTGAQIP